MKSKTNRVVEVFLVPGKAVFVMIFGTVIHQSTLGDQLNIGVVVALLLTLLIALEIRMVSTSRSAGWAFAVLLTLMLFVVGQDFWNDKMLPTNQAGLIWSFGAPIIAFAVLFWPRISKQQWNTK
ncbi:MAG: hypothetical protein P8M68_05870 [Aquiluna sp.]|nr:hypothetical protein [Aquiluna sp.]